ncbi:MAG: hypothetical protein WB795_12605 [Candidatus Acidiferrales bacterium]
MLAKTDKISHGSMHYTDFKFLNPFDVAHPVKVQFHVNDKWMYANPQAATLEQLTAALTAIPIREAHLTALLPKPDSKNDTNDKREEQPIDLKGPKSYSLSVNLRFDSLAKSDAPPRSTLRIDKDFAEYESGDEWNGNTFHASRSLTFRVSSGQRIVRKNSTSR